MGRVQGKTAVVTGGAKGMGAATVRLLAAEGARVVAADVDLGMARTVAAEFGEQVAAHQLDVRSPNEWDQVIAFAEERFGSVDILVNNAGVADAAPLEEWDQERLRQALDVNVLGAFAGIQAVIPAMKRAGGGSIVNIGSRGALEGIPMLSGYVVSKWGVRGLTKTAAVELGAYGIRVNAIHPGQIRTPMTAGITFDTSGVPLQRVGEPEEIAPAVLFFASDDSSFITGTELAIDGGQNAGQANYSGLPD